MCGHKSNKNKAWWQVKKQIADNPGRTLSGTTPGAELTGFSRTANRAVTGDLTVDDQDKSSSSISEEKFRSWYDPMFEAVVSDPAKALMGEGPAGLQGMDKFIGAQELLENAGLSGQLLSGALGAAGGEDAKLLKEDATDFKESGIKLDQAESQFKQEEESIEEGLKGAEQTKDDSILENRVQRQKALSESIPDYEKARAGLAKSGIAYSGPAMASVQASDEAREMGMEDISRDSSQIMKDFKDTRSLLEGKRSTAQEKLDTDRQLFATGLSGLLGNTETKANQILGNALQLPANWKKMGQNIGSGGLVGSDKYGGGMGDTKMFEEQVSDVGALTDLSSLINTTSNQASNLSNYFDNINFDNFTPEDSEG